MKNFWQPDIDNWIPESININNTAAFPTSYQYAPNEGEEEKKFKVHVDGQGKMSIEQIKEKISNYLKECDRLLGSDTIKDMERLQHHVNNPEITNLIQQLVSHIKQLKSEVQ